MSDLVPPNSRQAHCDESLQTAHEHAIEIKHRLLIDCTLDAICKYTNRVAGVTFLSNSDNQVRSMLIGLLLACEEDNKNAV